MTSSLHSVLHGESSKRLASPRNTKTGNTYNQPSRPNRHTTQTKHQALPKGQPGRRITPLNTAAVHTSAQPTIITHTRQAHHQILSANAARCEAHWLLAGAIQAGWLSRQAEPHTDTTRTSGDMQLPLPGGRHQEEVVDSRRRTASLWGEEGEGGGEG